MQHTRHLRRLRSVQSLTIALAVAGMLIAASQVSAIEYYTGNVVGQCEVFGGVTYNVKATIGPSSPNWFVSALQYDFSPVPAQLTSADRADDKVRYFLVTPGNYKVTAGNPALQGSYQVEAPDCSSPRKGLTWRLVSTNSPTGTVRVGCGNKECDAYKGDTSCTAALPVLCIKKSGPGFPLPVPATVNNTSRYNKWSGGVIGTTGATVPPATLAGVNELCAKHFGTGWRIAEHHDGWGWYFQAYGGVGDPASRFWVHINDQPGALCWN